MTLAATVPVVRALLDEARDKGYRGGVLGVSARPEWDGPTDFEHAGAPVHVAACPSALAVREVLPRRAEGRWLVVLTDRGDDDLGLGITAHLVGNRLRRPDPWEAVRHRFGATGVDHRLVADPATSRAIALGLLAATPAEGWPAAASGVLTRDHAFAAVAARWLGVGVDGLPTDARTVLAWSSGAGAAASVADLRADAGDALTDAVLAWLADQAGAARTAVLALLRAGRVGDVLPLGLVAEVVAGLPAESGPRALLESGQGVGGRLTTRQLRAWASEARLVAADLLARERPAATRVLARADVLLAELRAETAAGASTVLPSGLVARLADLGRALRAAAEPGPVTAAGLTAVESAWASVEGHALAVGEPLPVRRGHAGVRLARWLAQPEPPAGAGPGGRLAALVDRYRDDQGWVDRAYAEAWAGVPDEALALGLTSVAAAVRARREREDVEFAAGLAAEGVRPPASGGSWLPIESLLAGVVVPLAKEKETLLVVLDGMSVAAATAIADDVVGQVADGWVEAVPAARSRRLGAVAALPTITEVSRASLLCGEVTRGQQQHERAGFARLLGSHGLAGVLAHKASMDASGAGFDLAPDVRGAVDDVTGQRLVAVVLNTIDDALDRSDPGGADWTADAVKHLRPLLDRARRAGRAVVLTSDHGYVVERREGRQVGGLQTAGSNRARAAAGLAVDGGEVLVDGPRVATPDHRAVLAVDERLRYGPLKAGYHGGAAPAEAVIPVVVLVRGGAPEGWVLAPPQAPAWWAGPVAVGPAEPASGNGSVLAQALPASSTPTLFDDLPALRPAGPEPVTTRLAEAVLASPVYAQQRSRAARVAVADDAVATLLRALLAGPDQRLTRTAAAAALGVNEAVLSGALTQVRRLLNVEQYPVLGLDADGVTVVLDRALLVEQFGVPG